MIYHKYYCTFCGDNKAFEAPTSDECNDLWEQHKNTHIQERQRREAEILRDGRLNILEWNPCDLD